MFSHILGAMDPTAGVMVSAVVGALGAYFVAAKRFSGKIGSSDAADLWHESRSIRDWSQQQIAFLNSTIERLEGRVKALEANNLELVRENVQLNVQLDVSRKRIIELEATRG